MSAVGTERTIDRVRECLLVGVKQTQCGTQTISERDPEQTSRWQDSRGTLSGLGRTGAGAARAYAATFALSGPRCAVKDEKGCAMQMDKAMGMMK